MPARGEPAAASRRALLRRAIGAGALAAAGPSAALDAARAAAGAPPFSFALIGDTPYGTREELQLRRVLDDFDDDLAFAVHVGDIKGGREPCDDALLRERLALLASSRIPLVYVPGDNEWTDCARPAAGRFDPRERLAKLRELAFAAPVSLGRRTLPVQRQSDSGGPPENLRWTMPGMLFVSINLPGSNNGLDAEGLGEADRRGRDAWNERWLRETFAIAARQRLRAVAIAAHADPLFEHGWDPGQLRVRDDGYRPFRSLLKSLVEGFDGETLFLHGDSHRFRVDAPLPRLTRIECFGSPFASWWVRVDASPGSSPAFRVTARQPEPPRAPSTG